MTNTATQCTPAAPNPEATHHLNLHLYGVRPGGLRLYKCDDCEYTWQQTNSSDDPPRGPSVQEVGMRRPAEPLKDQTLAPLPHEHGWDANQLLIDALTRVNKGDTLWVAIVEIGPSGVPICSFSDGPATHALGAATALTFETHRMLNNVYERSEEHAGEG
jgi:hypothetical protein